ncbi:uncharacterized protein DS421_18g621440 [Arachis hypogaea]|nr:uncharacterized protein DS421_18g621440 [Arachis hypogaea]
MPPKHSAKAVHELVKGTLPEILKMPIEDEVEAGSVVEEDKGEDECNVHIVGRQDTQLMCAIRSTVCHHTSRKGTVMVLQLCSH